MQKPHERTLKMMENYVRLHEEGRSVSEIAKLYGLSTSTVYGRLAEIANKAGVSRKSLLEKPFTADHSGRNFTPVKPVNTTELERRFNEVLDNLKKVRAELSLCIAKQEENAKILIIREE